MPEQPNPTLARRWLAVRLRQARERCGRSLDELARELDVSLPQASRLDTGARGYSPAQVERLSDWYSLGSVERRRLAALGEESRRRAWWQKVDLRTGSYRTLIGLEQGAEKFSEFCPSVLPGLLQTPEYARASAESSLLEVRPGLVDQAVGVRMRRQALLDGDAPPVLWVVIDESALARTTGGAGIMGAQLDRLLAAGRRPRVTVQVLPFDRGQHIGVVTSHFILLDMRHDIPGVVYSEAGREPFDTEDPQDVGTYHRIWDHLRALALDQEASRELIGTYRNRLES